MIMQQRQTGLGRGLGALIPPKPAPQAPSPSEQFAARSTGPELEGQRILEAPIDKIARNPHQPRLTFDHSELEDLISSIREHGVLQPLIVTPQPDGTYQLIAGERRLRASTIAGLKTVPVIVRDATELQKLELAIIENVQRADLNPIEEAKAYQRLIDEFGMTQDEVGRKMGKSRPQVGNIVRLLQLPPEIQQALVERKISSSNGRTLLSLPTDEERMQLFRAMVDGNFTVRQTEERVGVRRLPRALDPNISAAEDRLRTKLHAKVSIKRNAKGVGEIRVHFGSDEELGSLLERL
jgi:ParB family chromosome partitioning protein